MNTGSGEIRAAEHRPIVWCNGSAFYQQQTLTGRRPPTFGNGAPAKLTIASASCSSAPRAHGSSIPLHVHSRRRVNRSCGLPTQDHHIMLLARQRVDQRVPDESVPPVMTIRISRVLCRQEVSTRVRWEIHCPQGISAALASPKSVAGFDPGWPGEPSHAD